MAHHTRTHRIRTEPHGQGARLGNHDLFPTIMPLGNRRHIPTAIKELMITLQTTKGLKKKQVAHLLDVNVRTVRRITKLEAETGSVVREPVLKGPRRMLNGIDCAVRRSRSIFRDPHTLRGILSILSRFWNEHQTFICTSSRETSPSAVVCTSHLAPSPQRFGKGASRERS